MNDWRKIPGICETFEASSCGSIRRWEDGSWVIRKAHKRYDGYISVSVKSKAGKWSSKEAHRLVWQAFNGETKKAIDHINRIKDDNRLINLRECTQSQNIANARKKSQNKLGYRGICLKRPENKFYAIVTKHGQVHKSDLFDTKKDAALAYDKLATKLHGEFASLNFPRKPQPKK